MMISIPHKIHAPLATPLAPPLDFLKACCHTAVIVKDYTCVLLILLIITF